MPLGLTESPGSTRGKSLGKAKPLFDPAAGILAAHLFVRFSSQVHSQMLLHPPRPFCASARWPAPVQSTYPWPHPSVPYPRFSFVPLHIPTGSARYGQPFQAAYHRQARKRISAGNSLFVSERRIRVLKVLFFGIFMALPAGASSAPDLIPSFGCFLIIGSIDFGHIPFIARGVYQVVHTNRGRKIIGFHTDGSFLHASSCLSFSSENRFSQSSSSNSQG